MDGIGLDNCALPFSGPPPSTDHSLFEYQRFHDAWLRVNRSINLQIWYSACHIHLFIDDNATVN